MTLVEKAQKVITFKMNIARECGKRCIKVPSNEVISDYINNGYEMNVSSFMKYYTSPKAKDKKDICDILKNEILESTLKLDTWILIGLWNKFIEESALYGPDSYIYDLANDEDCFFLERNMDCEAITKLVDVVKNNKDVRYIQWFPQQNNTIKVKKDIKGIITGFWGEIFERVLMYPSIYSNVRTNMGDYFCDIFFPVILKNLLEKKQ